MAKAGCMLIAWGIESANETVLKKAHKGYRLEQAGEALTWARQAGIMNWGYFIIGLPGETVEIHPGDNCTIKEAPAGYCPVPCRCAVPRDTVFL